MRQMAPLLFIDTKLCIRWRLYYTLTLTKVIVRRLQPGELCPHRLCVVKATFDHCPPIVSRLRRVIGMSTRTVALVTRF